MPSMKSLLGFGHQIASRLCVEFGNLLASWRCQVMGLELLAICATFHPFFLALELCPAWKQSQDHCPKPELREALGVGTSTGSHLQPRTDRLHGQAGQGCGELRAAEATRGWHQLRSHLLISRTPRAIPQLPLSSLETPKPDLSPAAGPEPTSKEPGR